MGKGNHRCSSGSASASGSYGRWNETAAACTCSDTEREIEAACGMGESAIPNRRPIAPHGRSLSALLADYLLDRRISRVYYADQVGAGTGLREEGEEHEKDGRDAWGHGDIVAADWPGYDAARLLAMAQESWKKSEETFQTPEAPILCVNNCGFFGSNMTNMCSKCYRDFIKVTTLDAPVVEKKVFTAMSSSTVPYYG